MSDRLETADWGDVVDIESIDCEDSYPRHLNAWLRLRDGREALWTFELGDPPGQDQRVRVIEET